MAKNKFRREPALKRLLDRVEVVAESGCWVWMGALTRWGYGIMTDSDQQRRHSHKVAYELFKGPVPKGLELDHLCRVRCCVNPHHLEAVTHKENLKRGRDAGFGSLVASRVRAELQRAQTHCHKGHEYTPENTRMYRGKRRCKACGRAHSLAQYRQTHTPRPKISRPTSPEIKQSITHCPKGHPYNAENTLVKPQGWRRCRECSRVQCHERRARRKAEKTLEGTPPPSVAN